MKKFKNAINGILLSIRDKSILIQIILAFLALLISIILKINKYEFIIILICISMVICCEILNTCIEKLCDLYSKEYNIDIKVIKDLAAGSVLFVSIISLIIGIIIFIPYL